MKVGIMLFQCPSVLLKEYVGDEAVGGDADDPEDEEEDSQGVLDEGVDGLEGEPVLAGHGADIVGGVETVLGASNRPLKFH